MTKAITKNSKKGFTLVELVVVIAILAILAAIAIPVVSSVINTASKNGALTNAQTIEIGIKECQADIAARNDDVYNGTKTIAGVKIPAASANGGRDIKLEHVILVKGVTGAFKPVSYDGAIFEPFWDKTTDKCVYLCTTANGEGDNVKVADGADLASDDLTKEYANRADCEKIITAEGKIADKAVLDL